MKTFSELELTKLHSILQTIYASVKADGDENSVYELNLMLEFRLKQGESVGRGIVTFGVAGEDGPSIFEM